MSRELAWNSSVSYPMKKNARVIEKHKRYRARNINENVLG